MVKLRLITCQMLPVKHALCLRFNNFTVRKNVFFFFYHRRHKTFHMVDACTVALLQEGSEFRGLSGPFRMELACAPRFRVDFLPILQFPPTVEKRVCLGHFGTLNCPYV